MPAISRLNAELGKQVHPWLLTGWPEAHARPSSRILLAHDLHTSLVATPCSILAACWGRHRRRCAGRFPEAVRQLYQRREYPRDGPQASSIEISVFHAISCRSVVNEANNSRDQFWAQHRPNLHLHPAMPTPQKQLRGNCPCQRCLEKTLVAASNRNEGLQVPSCSMDRRVHSRRAESWRALPPRTLRASRTTSGFVGKRQSSHWSCPSRYGLHQNQSEPFPFHGPGAQSMAAPNASAMTRASECEREIPHS